MVPCINGVFITRGCFIIISKGSVFLHENSICARNCVKLILKRIGGMIRLVVIICAWDRIYPCKDQVRVGGVFKTI